MKTISRRGFLSCTAGALAVSTSAGAPSDRVRLGVIGLGKRGSWHIRALTRTPKVHVCAVCDIHRVRLGRAAGFVEQKQRTPPGMFVDYRYLLDSHDVDAVAVAVPDSLRPAVVRYACQSGKHVLLAPKTILGLREGRDFEHYATDYRRLITVAQTYSLPYPTGVDWDRVKGVTLTGDRDGSPYALAMDGLDAARRILGLRLPCNVCTFELPGSSVAMSFSYPERRNVMTWEVRRAPSTGCNQTRVLFERNDRSEWIESVSPAESTAGFRPPQEQFLTFAQAVRSGDSRHVAASVSEARLTSVLLRLAKLSASWNRQISFDPVNEVLCESNNQFGAELG